ncbi:MAG: hypothetical protein ACLFS9_02825 [Nitriliruptoraceae bacterium]
MERTGTATVSPEATDPSSGGPPDTGIRPMRPGDEPDVRRLFRATLARGSAAPGGLGDLRAYEDLCLGWYLRAGTGLVVVEHGRIAGYLLACLDEADHRRWQRRHVARWVARSLAEVVTGRRRAQARRFVLLRLRDGLASARRAAPPAPAHAHVNLEPQLRGGRTGQLLARRMDALAAAAGHRAWYAEMNRPAGRPHASLARRGVRVVGRVPSATFTWLAGGPIERITLVREVRLAPVPVTATERAGR